MSRLGRTIVCILTAVLGISAAGATGSASPEASTSKVTTWVGPARFLSPRFGYTVSSRTVERGGTSHTRIGLFLYRRGRWVDSTPPRLTAKKYVGIDDVSFTDSRHGWIATYDCARAIGAIYRTRDGGRSWQSLANPGSHNCTGTTFLSFVDQSHGWMEPISPSGPVGELLRTVDGGRSWKVATPWPPCFAAIEFVSRTVGWMGCGARLFSTRNAGRRWRRDRIRVPAPAQAHVYDLPRFFGRQGIATAVLGRLSKNPELFRVISRKVAFMVSHDAGRAFALRSIRCIGRCAFISVPWGNGARPASVASSRVWWLVAGRRVQVTIDGGQHWRTSAARGLPTGPCSVLSVSAASARLAWVVAADGRRDNTALFQTRDGGRTWRRINLLGREARKRGAPDPKMVR